MVEHFEPPGDTLEQPQCPMSAPLKNIGRIVQMSLFEHVASGEQPACAAFADRVPDARARAILHSDCRGTALIDSPCRAAPDSTRCILKQVQIYDKIKSVY
jgi:hypothetical protein